MADKDGTRKGKKARDPNRWTRTERKDIQRQKEECH